MSDSYLSIFIILFVSTFIHSTLGFGQALIAMPLLAMAIELKTATPLVAFVLMTIATVILLRNWRVVDLGVVCWLCPIVMFRCACGTPYVKRRA